MQLHLDSLNIEQKQWAKAVRAVQGNPLEYKLLKASLLMSLSTSQNVELRSLLRTLLPDTYRASLDPPLRALFALSDNPPSAATLARKMALCQLTPLLAEMRPPSSFKFSPSVPVNGPAIICDTRMTSPCTVWSSGSACWWALQMMG